MKSIRILIVSLLGIQGLHGIAVYKRVVPGRTIAAHLIVMQQLKDHFGKRKKIKIIQPTAHPQTATQAYLSQYEKEVRIRWGTALETHKEMISDILAAEQHYHDTHYVFYHAQRGELRILQDFLKEFFQLLNIRRTLYNFNFLRFWQDHDLNNIDVNDFIDRYSPIYDTMPETRKKLLSVNLSLFGNTSYSGECTFDYFLNNTSVGSPYIEQALLDYFKKFNLNQKHIAALLQANNNIASYGNLFQIFIPKDKVDRCVYLSHAYGTPYNGSIVAHDFSYEKQRHTKISSILDVYYSDPATINKDYNNTLDQLQARILFTPDIMLNPRSGVKIIRYAGASTESMQAYHAKVKRIAHTVFLDFLATHTINKEDRARTKIDTILDHVEIDPTIDMPKPPLDSDATTVDTVILPCIPCIETPASIPLETIATNVDDHIPPLEALAIKIKDILWYIFKK